MDITGEDYSPQKVTSLCARNDSLDINQNATKVTFLGVWPMTTECAFRFPRSRNGKNRIRRSPKILAILAAISFRCEGC